MFFNINVPYRNILDDTLWYLDTRSQSYDFELQRQRCKNLQRNL
jgi:hypothetical protein